MDFMEAIGGRDRKISGESIISRPEIQRSERMFVDSKKTEYVSVDHHIAEKIHDLLASQTDMTSDDIKTVLLGGDRIVGANCHKTALFLTDRYTKEKLFSPDNDNPETAGHRDIEAGSVIYGDPGQFLQSLSKKVFPYRISFFKPRDGKDFAYHSLVVLGMTNKGTLVGFEKGGPYADNPFRFINATNSIAEHLQNGYTAGLEK